jgi:hypothetical protein
MTANNICQRTDTGLFGSSNIAAKKNDNYKNMSLLLYQNIYSCPLEGYKEGMIGVYILINNCHREACLQPTGVAFAVSLQKYPILLWS